MVIIHFITKINKSSWLYKLNRELNKREGISSYIICLKNNVESENIFELSIKYKIKAKLIVLFEKVLFFLNKSIPFSSNVFGVKILKNKKIKQLIEKSDIINIHWINGGFFSLKDIRDLNNLNEKKVFWRLYDSWAITGGCHVRMKCDNFINGCGNCKNLKLSNKFDITRFLYLYKKRKFINNKFNIITPSTYLEKQVKKSEFFKNSNIRTINNGVEKTFDFNRKYLIEYFNLDINKIYILFGATNINLKYKGFEYLINALNKLEYDVRENVVLLTFGDFSENDLIRDYELINFGFIKDREKLMKLFAVANFFVGPSVEESFGNVFLESMSVGTPCLLFDELGASYDLVEHKKNGYIAEPLNSEDLSKGLLWMIENSHNLRENCIRKVEKYFLLEQIVDKYLKLYAECDL